MGDSHRSGKVMETMQALLRVNLPAELAVWRDRVGVEWAEGTSDQRIVNLLQGPEEITQYVGPSIVDVDLFVDVQMIDKGRPTGQGGTSIPSTNVGTLRLTVTKILLGDNLGSVVDLGLSWVLLMEEVSAGAIEINEDGVTPRGSQTVTWRIRYRRDRVDPSDGS